MSDPDPNTPEKTRPGFWESLSREPPREGDKMKAVIFGIGLAIVFVALAWLMLHKNSAPLD